MPCYHPMIGIPSGRITENGKQKYVIKKSEGRKDVEKILKENEGSVIIPCGHCIGCRLDYSRKWADRMMLELETSKKAVFLTLTYDNEHVHYGTIWDVIDLDGKEMIVDGAMTLDKRDCQLFMKSLRQEFHDFRIRFFLSGEYGTKTQRPHYHIIVYGIDLNDIGDCVVWKRSELGDFYYLSERIRKLWKRGNILLADVNWKTCAYVARYICKKLSGDYKIHYYNNNILPEFSLMSRKPGIGREYLNQHPDCLDMKSINISTPTGGLKISIPKYYFNQLNVEGPLYDPEKYDKMMEERRRFASDKLTIKLQKTNLDLVEYLATEEKNKLAKIQGLKAHRDKL